MTTAPLPDPPAQEVPGALFLREIREQPAALLRVLGHADEFAAVAASARRRGLTTVRMVGHGSSDNAASYGVYAFGLLPRWTSSSARDSSSAAAAPAPSSASRRSRRS